MLSRLSGILAIVGLLVSLAILSSSAVGGAGYARDGGLVAQPSSSVASRPSVAIGTIPPASPRLARPRPDVVEEWLRADGTIPAGASAESVSEAVHSFYRRFAKERPAWVRPEFEQLALEREAELASGASAASEASANAAQPVTAKVLALAVDFGGTDTFSAWDNSSGSCIQVSVTKSGPLKGAIPTPGPDDNATIWYPPAQTANPAFYENLIFGYTGIGRVRMDLKDPDDDQWGINLAGYTVQDYYDRIAGAGNVTLVGSVQGWVTVDHSEAYYGADNCQTGARYGGGPVPVGQLVPDAIAKFQQAHPSYYTATSPSAFWKQYDADHNGIVDTLWIIHAGAGQEAGGGAEGTWAIWSHSSDLRNYSAWPNGFKVYEGDTGTIADDIYVGPYTMQPENLSLGVLTEEFGHNFFALPDLYTTDAENSIGFWSNMSAGSWGGYLGGSTPVGFPLWFRMIARCGATYCNWHEPMVTRAYSAAGGSVTIGQLESTPNGLAKGVMVTMPDITVVTDNLAGTGRAAYSGRDRDSTDVSLSRPISVPVGGAHILTFDSYSDIEADWDYGYVMVQDGGNPWVFLQDMDAKFTNTNPNGTNLGCGLTGTGATALRFDLSAYAGKTVTLRLRYRTDTSVTNAGWWIDNVQLDGSPIDAFENATPPGSFVGWTNTSPGWYVAPYTSSYSNYYLIEWRSPTKYDRMVRTAYLTQTNTMDTWRVNRIPYNIPGALIYYRDTRYGSSYNLRSAHGDPPSYGPKYQLLVVDVNPIPLRFTSADPTPVAGYTNSRTGSYDAALTLQDAPAMSVPGISGVSGGPFNFPAKPAVTSFDDGTGYYAGFYADAPCRAGYICYANRDGSAVVPARSDYTIRITTYDGTPYTALYGYVVNGYQLGTGNPRDSDAAWGVKMELVSKSADNTTAVIAFAFDPKRWLVELPFVSRP